MKIHSMIMCMLIFSLGQQDLRASSHHKHKHKSTREIVKEINRTTKQDLAVDTEILDIVSQFGCATVINNLPYTISQQGYYKLCGNLTYNPSAPNTNAITITSSNVVLDLDNYSISQQSGNTQPTTGIYVNPNLSAIAIVGVNGSIQDFQGWGIFGPGPNDVIKLQDITVQSCGSDARDSGLNALDGGINFGISGISPIAATQISQTLISNVKALNNKNTGISITGPLDLVIENTLIEGTYSLVPTSAVVGLSFGSASAEADPVPRATNVGIDNTHVSNASCLTIAAPGGNGPAGGVFGVLCGEVNNLVVTNSTFTNTVCAANNDNPVAPFIEFCANWVQGGMINCSFDNCVFADAEGDHWTLFVQNYHTSANTSPIPPDPGLAVSQNHVYKNCVASGTTGSYVSGGFNIYYARNVVFDKCQAMNNTLVTGLTGLYEAFSDSIAIVSGGFLIGGGYWGHFGSPRYRKCQRANPSGTCQGLLS